MGAIKVWIVKEDKLGSKALPADQMNAIEAHGCVAQPQYFYSLAEFPDINSYHQRCLSVKANCVAGLGYRFMGKNSTVTEAFIKKHKTPEQTFTDILTQFWYDYELFGNGSLELARIGTKLARIHHISGRDIYRQRDKKGYWQIMPDGKERQFAAYREEIMTKSDKRLHEIIQLREYTPVSGYYGLPKYLGSLMGMSINRVIANYNLNFFENSGIPDLAIIIEGGEFDEKTEKEVQEYLQTNIKGVANAHKTLYIPVTNPNVKVRIEKLNDVKDGHFRFLRSDNRDEILSVHGVPPRLAGVVVSGALGGSGEHLGQMRAFLQIDIRPKQKKLEEFLNTLFEIELGENPGIKFKELDITTALEDAQRYQIYSQGEILTQDEIREELGREPLKRNTQQDILNSLRDIRKSINHGNRI